MTPIKCSSTSSLSKTPPAASHESLEDFVALPCRDQNQKRAGENPALKTKRMITKNGQEPENSVAPVANRDGIMPLTQVIEPSVGTFVSETTVDSTGVVPGQGLLTDIKEITAFAGETQNVRRKKLQVRPSGRRLPVKGGIDIDRIHRIGREGATLSEMEQLSKPIPDPAEILSTLFPGDPLICGDFPEPRGGVIRPMACWIQNLDRMRYIVPNPVRDRNGRRCVSNVLARDYQVVEFDMGDSELPEISRMLQELRAQGRTPQDLSAALLMELQTYVPMPLAVFSGNLSIHGWFTCRNLPDADIRKFQALARRLGADPSMFSPCQYTRRPGGIHQNGNAQQVVYYNPEAVK